MSTKIKEDGGPAFGEFQKVGDIARSFGGVTVRDYFAAKALQGLLAGSQITGNGGLDNWRESHMADFAFCLADAMLEARKS